MLKYCTKRILLAILTIFIVAAITFFAMNAIPGGPFNKEKATSEAAKAVLEARFNLDKPVGEQFILYLKNLMHGAQERARHIRDDMGRVQRVGQTGRHGGRDSHSWRAAAGLDCGAYAQPLARPVDNIRDYAVCVGAQFCSGHNTYAGVLSYAGLVQRVFDHRR